MNICVYCSSSNSISENYKTSARKFGEWIAESGNTLVFGGATGGLMTEVSEGAARKGGKIIGIIPHAVKRMNRQSTLCTELVEVSTMSERKEKMREFTDVFVVLPGSIGTLDEFFDVYASGTVGEHRKQIILVNENGFYEHLLLMIEKMKNEQFIVAESYKPMVVNSIDECIEGIMANDK